MMLMFDVERFRLEIVRPTIQYIGHHSTDAEKLILETGMQESRLTYIWQIGGGPGAGPYQMETHTHQDIWNNYLKFRTDLSDKVESFLAPHPSKIKQLVGNMYYATAMCRVHYLRQKGPIPKTLEGRADYWKLHYNTPLGKGTAEQYIENANNYLWGNSE